MNNQTLKKDKNLLKEFRAEVNLLKFPFFALTTKDIFNRKKTEFSTVVERGDEKLEIKWKVSSDPEYGYPGPFEKKVHRAMEQMFDKMDLPLANPITFSTYKLCKIMGISIGGRQYKRVKDALLCIKTTSIRSKGTFYQKKRKKWVDDIFNLYDRIVFKGEQLGDGEVAETNYLYLNDVYLESLNARYVKPLDYSYYRSLETNIAKRLYELLGVKFFGIYSSELNYIRYRYSTLCKLLPLKRQRYPSYARRQFESAHKELVESDFLEGVEWEGTKADRDWLIHYFPGSRVEDEIERNLPSASEKDDVFLTEGQKASVSSWISELTQTLDDQKGNNEGFYVKLGRLITLKEISEPLVRKTLSEVKSEAQLRELNKDEDPIKNKSAYFTGLLKSRLKKKGKDLNKLLENI